MLVPDVAARLGHGLGVDPSPVRVHTDSVSASATAALGVRAFTWGVDVFLAEGERPTDVPLLAHEVTHAIQQSGGPAIHLFDGPHGELEHEAHQNAAVVASGGQAAVHGRTSGPGVQGLFGWAKRGLAAVGGAISTAAGAVADVAADVADAVRDRALAFVKDKARAIPGYDLLCFVLGRDPITQQTVERTAENLIKGVLDLVPGGDALFANLQQAKVIQRAHDWFTAEIAKLNITWDVIRGLFAQAWDALDLTDLSGTWDRLKDIFGPPLSRLRTFAVDAGHKVLEFVFEGALAMAGGAGQQVLNVFRRIGSVFDLIVADPVKFLANLLTAVKGGFNQFRASIGVHLRTGVFEWLTGTMQGVIQLPSKWDFSGILSLILQILGLTYSNLRTILVKVLGEKAVTIIEQAFGFLSLIVKNGLSAAWEKIKEFAGGLADQVITAIRNWIAESVVGAAVAKLVTIFNPVGAIIQGIITIYNTIMFFLERIQQIGRLVNSILDSIENIAKGATKSASDFVEQTLANTLPVIIGFLARLAGLGNVTDYIRDIIGKIRATIAAALEKLGLWIKDSVKGLLAGKPSTATSPEAEVSTGDTPQAAAIKEAAVQEIQSATEEKKLETIDDLHGLLNATLMKLKPRGLQSLSARIADEAMLDISITAVASPPRSFVLPWAQAFRAHPPAAEEIAELKEAFQQQGYETNAAVTVDGQLIGSETSGSGAHAEIHVLNSGLWDSALAQARTAAKTRGSSELAFLINRSPCHSICTPELIKALNKAKSSNPGVRFVLAPTGVYEPTIELTEQEIRSYAESLTKDIRVPLKRAYLREDVDNPNKGGITTMNDIYHLQAAGWQLQQLLARPVSTSAGKLWLMAIENAAKRAIAQKVGTDNSKVS